MTHLIFTGTVQLGDSARVGASVYDYTTKKLKYLDDGAIIVGGRDLVGEVHQATWAGPVIVGIGDERFIGEPRVDLGYGYSEYTPMGDDSLSIGDHDIVDYLEKLAGQTVVVTISDESINLVELQAEARRTLDA